MTEGIFSLLFSVVVVVVVGIVNFKMVLKTLCMATLAASTVAFSPANVPSSSRSVTCLNADMSKSIPFLVRPEKLDGSMPGDVGFDPMGLSEIQQDLNYARWAEIKHGRISMLAILGMLTQEYGPLNSGWHIPGDQFSEMADPFAAVSKVGFVGNFQIFLGIGLIELTNFNKHYEDGMPGDIGWDFIGLCKGMTPAELKRRQEQEIVHGRLAMIAITGASIQTLVLHQKLLDF